ncbi:MAG: hypothetical protein OK457_05420 [Thaumarchaeota archaeon]|nr:hypothetical protein [Nitrososphaerota archaeon]
MKSSFKFSGIHAILATPFDEQEEVDVESLKITWSNLNLMRE